MNKVITVQDQLVYRVITNVATAQNLHCGSPMPMPIKKNNVPRSPQKQETEDLFEEIRQKSYPHLPSRKSVLFVLPNNSDIVDRWVASQNPRNSCDYVLCTLRVTGTLIWCDEDKFTQAGPLQSQRRTLAKNYWESASDSSDDFDMPEGLFLGDAIVEKIEERHYNSPNVLF